MRNAGQPPFAMPNDIDALARQYWSSWADAMRGATPAAPDAPNTSPWQQPMQWWTQQAGGGHPQSNDVLARFNGHAQQWLSMMQQVAAQCSGRDVGAADITSAWRKALEGMGGMNGMPAMGASAWPGAAGLGTPSGNPFATLMQGMQQAPGLHGFDQWMAHAGPWIKSMQDASATMPTAAAIPQLPTFGHNRERDERRQRLMRDQMDLQARLQAYNALMMRATQDAFAVFESRLAEHEEPGRQLTSARALFDTWIDAAEQAYAKVALSPEFRTVYGELVNAQMRVRGGLQREVEQACEQFGMPTRTELDGAHRKIVELERQMRRLRDAVPLAASRRQTPPGDTANVQPLGRSDGAASADSRPARKVARKTVTRSAVKTVPKAATHTVVKTVPKPAAARKRAKALTQPASAAAVEEAALATRVSRQRKQKAAARRAHSAGKSPSASPSRKGKSTSKKTPAKKTITEKTVVKKAATKKAAAKTIAAKKIAAKKIAAKKSLAKPSKTSKAARAPGAVKRSPLPIFAHASMPVTPRKTSRKAR